MNKQELIEGIEAVPAHNTRTRPWIDKKIVLGLIRQLDEPQKVVVPQFVADVIEEAREESSELEDAFEYARDVAFRGEMGEWFMKLQNRNNFARAWLDGYQTEEEKWYTVVIKKTKQPLYYNASENKLFFSMAKIASHFTRQQLEKLNFGWVFDCEGIEIEEVEG
nr:MAG TPA: Protein of unknown function (DUF1642) [Caudoviricetes sp.]